MNNLKRRPALAASHLASAAAAALLTLIAILPDAHAGRDPWAQPAASDSIWNTPIGSSAQYVDAGMSTYASSFQDTDEEYYGRQLDSDPTTTLQFPDGSSLWFYPTLKLPYYFISPSQNGGGNYCSAFVLSNGRSVVSFQPTTRTTYGGALKGYVTGHNEDDTDNSLLGECRKGSHFGSLMSSLAGSVRLGELTSAQPITHALKLILSEKYMYKGNVTVPDSSTPNWPGWRWPAYNADGAAQSIYTGSNTYMGMGTLLAIPNSVTDPAQLGITTAPGKQMFWALRNYGGYVVDTAGDWGGGSFPQSFAVESGVGQEIQDYFNLALESGNDQPFAADVQRLYRALKAVADNSPSAKGGAGSRLAAAAPALNAQIGPIANGDYAIKAFNTNECLDDFGFSTANNNQVGLWNYVGGANQQWTLTNVGNGFYKIINKYSGKALNFASATMSDAQLQQYDYSGADNQLFTLLPDGNGYYRIQARHSGKVLDVSGGNFSNGVAVQQYHWNGMNPQRWQLAPLGGATLASGTVYKVEPECAPGKCLDVSGVSTADGANVQIWDFVGGANQKWKAIDSGGGCWQFEPQHAPGKRLDVNAAGSSDGTNVQQWTSNSSVAQLWKLYDNGDGTLSLEPQCASGKRLDVNGAGSANGTNVQIWTGNGSSAQRWKFSAQ